MDKDFKQWLQDEIKIRGNPTLVIYYQGFECHKTVWCLWYSRCDIALVECDMEVVVGK
jgi:hypothetical protein